MSISNINDSILRALTPELDSVSSPIFNTPTDQVSFWTPQEYEPLSSFSLENDYFKYINPTDVTLNHGTFLSLDHGFRTDIDIKPIDFNSTKYDIPIRCDNGTVINFTATRTPSYKFPESSENWLNPLVIFATNAVHTVTRFISEQATAIAGLFSSRPDPFKNIENQPVFLAKTNSFKAPQINEAGAQEKPAGPNTFLPKNIFTKINTNTSTSNLSRAIDFGGFTHVSFNASPIVLASTSKFAPNTHSPSSPHNEFSSNSETWSNGSFINKLNLNIPVVTETRREKLFA